MSDKQAWMACWTHSGNVLVREEDFTFPHLDIYSVDFTHLTNQMRCFKTLLYLLYIYIPHLQRTFGKGRSFEKVTGKWVDELPSKRTKEPIAHSFPLLWGWPMRDMHLLCGEMDPTAISAHLWYCTFVGLCECISDWEFWNWAVSKPVRFHITIYL